MSLSAPAPAPEDRRLAVIRKLLLALLIVGSLGQLTDLLLMEHYESISQLSPLVLLTVGLISAAVLWLRPTRNAVRFFRALMVAFVLVALVGMTLHYESNADLEREMDSTIGGRELAWYAIRGATPTLAPGALLQLGILGLILAYRHPASRPSKETGAET